MLHNQKRDCCGMYGRIIVAGITTPTLCDLGAAPIETCVQQDALENDEPITCHKSSTMLLPESVYDRLMDNVILYDSPCNLYSRIGDKVNLVQSKKTFIQIESEIGHHELGNVDELIIVRCGQSYESEFAISIKLHDSVKPTDL